ncbi:hypothetical protein P5673_003859, partial [Acropora cervicornis]
MTEGESKTVWKEQRKTNQYYFEESVV